jgi:hypothetical protein
MEGLAGFLIFLEGLAGLIFVLYLYAIVRIASVEFKNSCDRVFWFLAVVFIPILGLILWFVVGGKHIKKEGSEV